MSDVTRILGRIESDPAAADQLLPLVYHELRRLAAAQMSQERSDHTLQATALVHEAYLRLVDVDTPQDWNSRGHFFAAAAEAMRRILIERARRKNSLRHGGGRKREACIEPVAAFEYPAEDLLALDEALLRLEREHPEQARLVKLRFYAGLGLEEAAEALGVSLATAKRRWTHARAWLFGQLEGTPMTNPPSPPDQAPFVLRENGGRREKREGEEHSS